MTKTSGCPGRSGRARRRTRPARSSGTPSVRAERRGRHPRRPEHRPRRDPLAADGHPVGVDGRDQPPVRTSTPRRTSCLLRLLRELAGCKAGSTRGDPSSRMTCACVGSMRRKSFASACRAISQSDAGSSTPVGPAADDDERQPGFLPRRDRSRARPPRRPRAPGGGSPARPRSLLSPGANGLPLVVAEVRVRRAGGDDQVVVVELAVGRARRSSSRDRSTAPRRAIPRRSSACGGCGGSASAMSLGLSAAVATW